MPTQTVSAAPPQPWTGGWLVDPAGREFPLRGATLRADAAAGLARTVLEQHFDNPHDEPLRLTTGSLCPRRAPWRGSTPVVGERTVIGEIRARSTAREAFEQALLALVASTTRIGCVFRWPRTHCLASCWPSKCVTRWRPRANQHHRRIQSASQRGTGGLSVAFNDDSGAPLDRDVVVRWPVARPTPGVRLDVARPPEGHPKADSAFGLLTMEHGGRFSAELRERLPRAAEISKSLRRERELAFYGDIDFIPTEEYTEAHGRAAYDGATFVLALAQAVMRQLPEPH